MTKGPPMSLFTAHRILIATAVVFFFGFSLWQLRRYLIVGEFWAGAQALFYLAVALGFGVYFRSLRSWLK